MFKVPFSKLCRLGDSGERCRFFGVVAAVSALFLWSATASSAQVEGLYQASVPVSEASERVQNSALNQTLARVLVKVSGSKDVLRAQVGREGVSAALRNAQSLVQEFDFQDRGDRVFLHAVFDAGSIDELLAQSGLPVWGRERPVTLVWLAVDVQGQRFLLSSENGAGIAKVLNHQANLRGIPVDLPIMDIADRQALSYSDVAGGFTDRVMTASQRYGDRSVLMGHLVQQATGKWDVQWTYRLSEVLRTWSARGLGLSAAMQSGIDGNADALAQRYAAKPGTNAQLVVQIKGINGVAGYARVMNYLQGLSVVSDVQPVKIDDGMGLFRIDVAGDRRILLDVIALQSILQDTGAQASDVNLVLELLN